MEDKTTLAWLFKHILISALILTWALVIPCMFGSILGVTWGILAGLVTLGSTGGVLMVVANSRDY